MLLQENLAKILLRIKDGNNKGEKITLVGATKTMPVEVINQAIENGLTVVAENKVQEFNEKHSLINPCAKQHFIGHLQTNKVKYVVGNVDLIHSVDSLHLAESISKQALKLGITQKILVEINIGGELTKSGICPQDALSQISQIKKLPNVSVVGIMAMLPKSQDKNLITGLCLQMREIFDTLKSEDSFITTLSMGMSEDYEIAIRNGSNMIRIGSLIFGKRNYGEINNGNI